VLPVYSEMTLKCSYFALITHDNVATTYSSLLKLKRMRNENCLEVGSVVCEFIGLFPYLFTSMCFGLIINRHILQLIGVSDGAIGARLPT